MSFYDLLKEQRNLLTQMCQAYEQSGTSSFIFIAVSGGSYVEFVNRNGARANVPGISSDDLRAFADESLITVRFSQRDGRLSGGALKQSAVDAVKNEFRRPTPPPAAVGIYQSFYAPVGAVHAGAGNISITTQNINLPAEELAAIIAGLRSALGSVPEPARAEAAETLQELEAELAAPVPKQVRIKSYLLSLWSAAGQVAEFGANVLQIAQAYGIDPKAFV